MTPDTLRTAISEAERFLKAAYKALGACDKHSFDNQTVTAAAKRASMDLTKALAAMRART